MWVVKLYWTLNLYVMPLMLLSNTLILWFHKLWERIKWKCARAPLLSSLFHPFKTVMFAALKTLNDCVGIYHTLYNLIYTVCFVRLQSCTKWKNTGCAETHEEAKEERGWFQGFEIAASLVWFIWHCNDPNRQIKEVSYILCWLLFLFRFCLSWLNGCIYEEQMH